MDSRRRGYVKRVLLLSLGIAACTWVITRGPIPFESSVWMNNAENWDDEWHRRHRIADWLVLTRSLNGLSQAELTKKLGTPDTETFKGWSLTYYLGTQRGFFAIDDEWLVIRLDDNGKVVDAAVVVAG